MNLFELVKNRFPNSTLLHIHLCDFQIKHGVKKWMTCQFINYNDTTTVAIISQLELFRSSEILQGFDFARQETSMSND